MQSSEPWQGTEYSTMLPVYDPDGWSSQDLNFTTFVTPLLRMPIHFKLPQKNAILDSYSVNNVVMADKAPSSIKAISFWPRSLKGKNVNSHQVLFFNLRTWTIKEHNKWRKLCTYRVLTAAKSLNITFKILQIWLLRKFLLNNKNNTTLHKFH